MLLATCTLCVQNVIVSHVVGRRILLYRMYNERFLGDVRLSYISTQMLCLIVGTCICLAAAALKRIYFSLPLFG